MTGRSAAGDRELDELAWLTLAEAGEQDLPAITRFVLGEVRARLQTPDRPARQARTSPCRIRARR